MWQPMIVQPLRRGVCSAACVTEQSTLQQSRAQCKASTCYVKPEYGLMIPPVNVQPDGCAYEFAAHLV